MTAPAPGGLAHSRPVELAVDAGHRCAALLLLVVLSPVLLGVALLVLATSGAPVFYRQVRIGQFGRPFRIVKFRTMHRGADARLAAVLAAQGDGVTPFFKVKDDPRVTRVGRVLRRTSLDELPQLFNVFGGSMSLVGPRPTLPSEVEGYSTETHRRMHVRPGRTGLWQVSGRSDLSWDESIRLDLRYVENWSLALDALILWKTVGAVLRGDGAY